MVENFLHLLVALFPQAVDDFKRSLPEIHRPNLGAINHPVDLVFLGMAGHVGGVFFLPASDGEEPGKMRSLVEALVAQNQARPFAALLHP